MKILSERRQRLLLRQPLKADEFVSALARCEPVYKYFNFITLAVNSVANVDLNEFIYGEADGLDTVAESVIGNCNSIALE